MKTTVQKIEPSPGQRIIVTSDIHGHLDFLIQLLRKVNYSGDDVLVIVGDLVDKGPDSLMTLRYVMELAGKNQVYLTLGNVDLHRIEFLLDESEEADARFAWAVHRLEENWHCGLLLDMLGELGIPVNKLTEETAGKYRQLLREHFAEEISFLKSRPVVLEMGRYLFVHGGLPTDDLSQIEGKDAEGFLKNDCFLRQGHRFSRTVVVGHWPVDLYREGEENLKPILDAEQGIICIDGGCGLKETGQLNALVLPGPEARMEEIRWEYYDEFPEIIAGEAQQGRTADVDVKYFDSRVELLEDRGDMLVLRQESTKKVFAVPKSHTWTDADGNLHSDDYCDTVLEVRPGDRLSVIWKTSAGCYGKKDGALGWYYGAYRDCPRTLSLVSGRPLEEKGRRQRELAVYDLLDRLGISYSRIDHRAAGTMAVCAAIDEALDAVICKNLFLRNQQKTMFYLLLMPGEKKFKTKELSRQIGSARLSFAEPEFMEKYLQVSPGSVSVTGLMNDWENHIRLLIDRDLMKGEYIGCHPCVNTTSIRLRREDLTDKFLPAVGHEPTWVELTGED